MAIPSTSLIHSWDHNDAASWPGSGSVVTDTVQEIDGTLTNATEAEGGIDFNGSTTRLVFANNASHDNVWSGGGTIAFAVRIESDGEGSSGYIAATFETTSQADGWAIFTRDESGPNVDIELYMSFTGNAGRWYTTLTKNEWHVVVIQYDSSSASNDPVFFVDGVQASSTERATPSGTERSDAGRDLSWGNTGAATNRTFDGQIDAGALWDSDTVDAAAIYNAWSPRFADAPQITGVTPATETEITADTELGFDITDAVGLLLPVVYAPAATGDASRPVAWELVHNGSEFLDGYSGTRTAITNGYRYRVTRDAGWNVQNPQLVVLATDADGNDVEIS